MQPSERGVSDREVRIALVRYYAQLAAQYTSARHSSWHDRLAAAASGEVLVEPGWMLRHIVGDDVDVYGLYRVYGDGRIERDRFLEHEERERFHRAAKADGTASGTCSRLRGL